MICWSSGQVRYSSSCFPQVPSLNHFGIVAPPFPFPPKKDKHFVINPRRMYLKLVTFDGRVMFTFLSY